MQSPLPSIALSHFQLFVNEILPIAYEGMVFVDSLAVVMALGAGLISLGLATMLIDTSQTTEALECDAECAPCNHQADRLRLGTVA